MFGRGKKEPEAVHLQWTIEWYGTDHVDDEYLLLRRIVREELAELVPVDVPDAPPEDLR